MRKNKSVFIAIAVLYSLFFVSVSEAAFYEVNGRISLDGKAFRRVSAYLLYDMPERDIGQKSFSEEYSLLEQERSGAVQEAKERIRQRLQDLARKYKAERIVVDRKGEFYLNVSPGRVCYVFVLKQPAFLEHQKNIEFWLTKFYFNPGEVLDPVEITLDESNISVW